jgi:Mobilization protein NikA
VSPCPAGRRRGRGGQLRGHKVTVRLSDGELAAIAAAADRTGLALAAYISTAAIDAAEHRAAPVSEIEREALAELIRAAGLMRRAGVNLNQAVARLHSTGQPGPDLGPAAEYCLRVAHRVDDAATGISRRLR